MFEFKCDINLNALKRKIKGAGLLELSSCLLTLVGHRMLLALLISEIHNLKLK